MNRRNFFSVVAGFVASLCLPKLGRAITATADVNGKLPPPVEYQGDVDDPRYHLENFHWQRRVGLSCFVNGVDRNAEVYECYAGENGWANLILKEHGPNGLRTVRFNGDVVRYSIRGHVEFLPDAKSYSQGVELSPSAQAHYQYRNTEAS